MEKKTKKRHAKIFVSWHDVLKVKRKCEPKDMQSTAKVVVQVPRCIVNLPIKKTMEKSYIRERYNLSPIYAYFVWDKYRIL